MLIKDYYKINKVSETVDGSTCFDLTLIPDCDVYRGHFPDEPISPGVCNIQMIKECAEQVIGKPMLMDNLQQCRLTTLVTPLKHTDVEVVLRLEEKDGVYKLKATLGKNADIYLEMKADLKNE